MKNKRLSKLIEIMFRAVIIVSLFFVGKLSVYAAGPGDVVINEIMQNPAAVSDSAGEWFELFNTTAVGIDIEGWTIEDNDIDIHTINTGSSLVIPAGGYLILGNNSDSDANGGVMVDYVYGSEWFLSNGADEIVVLDQSLIEIDRVEYDGGTIFPDPSGASMSLANPMLDNSVGTNWCTSSTVFGDGDLGTPGSVNACPLDIEFGQCGDPATFIHEIQGNGSSSPEQGSTHVIEGVVVGDFQNIGGVHLGGFFVQEEDYEVDADPVTSEGIFVYEGLFPLVDVSAGDVVRVLGMVAEYNGLTELQDISTVMVCSSGEVATAETVMLPVLSLDVWEQYEGMLITLPQTLYATDNYNLGRYGEIDLSVNGRLYTPTNVVAPGVDALVMQDLNDRSVIQMDDGSTVQNPDPVPYLASDNTLRVGDTIAGLSGVLGFSFGSYEMHPTVAVDFTRENERTPLPMINGSKLKVASFNLLNYFITIDDSGPICGPSGDLGCRGADTLEEFNRQRDKIIKAIVTMDVDVIGLMELENHLSDSALIDLVDGLNVMAGVGTYSFIPTGPIGADAIKVGFIYKPAEVTPFGSFAILDSSVDPTFFDTKNRPALAQTFQLNSNGEKFTAVVNHFKSKGSPCDDLGDPDIGDGQGNCNLTRTSAAIALTNWLATDPTTSGDPDYLIIGDLNAYAMEDPITVFKDDGYTNLIEQFIYNPYSYVFFGQAGYLDHALASGNLAGQVSDVAVWHVNADEPSALDYNDYNQAYLYNPDPYRSSDHDPVIVELDFNAPPDCSDAVPSKVSLWPPNHKLIPIDILGVKDPDGDPVSIRVDSIFQDEPVDSKGDGKFAPDGFGVGASALLIRAERKGRKGNGRVYHIGFTALDDRGGQCSGSVKVGVPKKKKKKSVPVDDGPIYDSTVY